jgi:hypothetical protein
VGSSLESPLVGLHNVELRAIVSADLISIAVVKSISIPVLAGRIFTRSRNEIESSYASAVALAEVNIIVDSSAKKVGPEEVVGIKGCTLRKVASATEGNNDVRAARLV